MTAPTLYVHVREGNLYVGTSRVTLDSVIVPWKAGQSPEQIHADFPALLLSDIYGAIAYYLEHQDEVDAWLREGDALYERRRMQQYAAHPEFYRLMRERLDAARARLEADAAEIAPSQPTE